MEGDIFLRQIIVVLIIGVKIFHFFFIERRFQDCILFLGAEITAVCQIGDRNGQRRGKMQLH